VTRFPGGPMNRYLSSEKGPGSSFTGSAALAAALSGVFCVTFSSGLAAGLSVLGGFFCAEAEVRRSKRQSKRRKRCTGDSKDVLGSEPVFINPGELSMMQGLKRLSWCCSTHG